MGVVELLGVEQHTHGAADAGHRGHARELPSVSELSRMSETFFYATVKSAEPTCSTPAAVVFTLSVTMPSATRSSRRPRPERGQGRADLLDGDVVEDQPGKRHGVPPRCGHGSGLGFTPCPHLPGRGRVRTCRPLIDHPRATYSLLTLRPKTSDCRTFDPAASSPAKLSMEATTKGSP